jgi:hypothetical protein
VWAEKKRETDFADKVVHACIANYDSDGLGRLCATEQSRSRYLNIPKFQTEKRMFKLRVGYFSLNLI